MLQIAQKMARDALDWFDIPESELFLAAYPDGIFICDDYRMTGCFADFQKLHRVCDRGW